ncbi:hypothetical protein FLK61_25510 [Paenalkalicoccus suaedae]|uniref:Sporulation membrane protein YtaF n=1 Tax=Paenalkalicoccus suaedae TaxID=2592382 RepID=A0A859FBN8_9BACI|nr:hypothetical protein [Paenalkalicoccus suaedae]QKS70131.1 hypothetical protein FLK61_25510 [Paenalkalicoccus suaedae]
MIEGSILLIFLALDGVIWGLVIGTKRLYVPLYQVVLLALGTCIMLFFSLWIGELIGGVVPSVVFQKLAGALLLIMSVYQLLREEALAKSLTFKVFILMNIDNVGYGLAIGNFAGFLSIAGGVLVGSAFILGLAMSYQNPKLQHYKEILPFIVLFSLGMIKLLS